MFPHDHGFGTLRVLEHIKHACTTNKPTTGCVAKGVPAASVPSGIRSRMEPWLTQYAIRAAIDNDVGAGVPSKYCDFPVLSFGSVATVTLNRASLRSAQMTKKVKQTWSTVVRMPIANAQAAGAAPKDILRLSAIAAANALNNWLTRSAKESSSCPMSDAFPLHLATLPSKKSKNNPKGMKARALQRCV